jgi:hypothetical protein
MAAPTKAELRKFGLSVGAAFLVLGTLSWWRGHELPPRILWGIAAGLVVPGLIAPVLLGPVQRGWMAAAMFLGHVNTRIILSLLFYAVITPIGFVMRLFRDPLDRSLERPGDSTWIKRTLEPVDPARYERQF